MAQLEIVDRSILHINPDPAHYHVFASHSHPLQLSEQEFICTYQLGAGMYAADVNIALLRSFDSGVTWTHEGFLHDKSVDDRPYSYHDGFASRMSDGTLVVLAFRADRSQPNRRMFSPSGGLIENETVLFFSYDDGHTWTGPQPVELREGLVATPAGPIVELEDGSWLAMFDRWHGYEDDVPYKPLMLAFFSTNRGHTWDDMLVVADGEPEGKGFWHGKAIRLEKGQLYAMFWSANMTQKDKGPVDLPIHYAFADKTGRNWSRPEPTSIPGQTNWPTELPEGRLCAIYTWRETERPGFMVVLSKDGGRTWDVDNAVRLWDATGWTHIGISSPDKYPHSHDTIAFGAPTLVTTLEGELYASWWCTYASLTHIRWARLRVVD